MERIAKLEADFQTMRSLLQKLLDPEGKITVNLTVEEMLVRVQHAGDIEKTVDTKTVPGRILFCALKDLRDPQDPEKLWQQVELLKVMKERSWNLSSGTLSNAVSRLVSDGFLVNVERGGYRLPKHVKFVGDEL